MILALICASIFAAFIGLCYGIAMVKVAKMSERGRVAILSHLQFYILHICVTIVMMMGLFSSLCLELIVSSTSFSLCATVFQSIGCIGVVVISFIDMAGD